MSSRDIAEAYETVKKYLALPNPPVAVITHFPEHTEGLLKAVNELPSDERSKIITFGMGTQKAAVEAIAQGSHTGEIDFMPDLFAQLVVRAVNSLNANELWEYETQIENGAYNVQARFSPIRLITKENIKLLTERMKELEKNRTELQENQKSKESNSKENDENTQKNKTEQAEGKKKSIVIIKTKDGQEFKMDISGDIESIEMKGEEKQEGEGE
jgi:ABC-type sugar transport system substrate-binding protein